MRWYFVVILLVAACASPQRRDVLALQSDAPLREQAGQRDPTEAVAVAEGRVRSVQAGDSAWAMFARGDRGAWSLSLALPQVAPPVEAGAPVRVERRQRATRRAPALTVTRLERDDGTLILWHAIAADPRELTWPLGLTARPTSAEREPECGECGCWSRPDLVIQTADGERTVDLGDPVLLPGGHTLLVLDHVQATPPPTRQCQPETQSRLEVVILAAR